MRNNFTYVAARVASDQEGQSGTRLLATRARKLVSMLIG